MQWGHGFDSWRQYELDVWMLSTGSDTEKLLLIIFITLRVTNSAGNLCYKHRDQMILNSCEYRIYLVRISETYDNVDLHLKKKIIGLQNYSLVTLTHS